MRRTSPRPACSRPGAARRIAAPCRDLGMEHVVIGEQLRDPRRKVRAAFVRGDAPGERDPHWKLAVGMQQRLGHEQADEHCDVRLADGQRLVEAAEDHHDVHRRQKARPTNDVTQVRARHRGVVTDQMPSISLGPDLLAADHRRDLAHLVDAKLGAAETQPIAARPIATPLQRRHKQTSGVRNDAPNR